MIEVAKKQFFDAIGRLNVHPSIQPGPYPYTSLWQTPDRQTVGKSVGRTDGTSTYYLPESRP